MIPVTREEFSIRKWPLYFAAAVFVIFFYILYQRNELDDVASIVAGIGLAVFICLYYMLSKNRLVIESEGITQELFFGKARSIQWKDVKATHFNWHIHGHGANLEWRIEPYSGKAISLQTGFYSRKTMQLIAEMLVTQCLTADIDKRTRNIAEGNFPWYIF